MKYAIKLLVFVSWMWLHCTISFSAAKAEWQQAYWLKRQAIAAERQAQSLEVFTDCGETID